MSAHWTSSFQVFNEQEWEVCVMANGSLTMEKTKTCTGCQSKERCCVCRRRLCGLNQSNACRFEPVIIIGARYYCSTCVPKSLRGWWRFLSLSRSRARLYSWGLEKRWVFFYYLLVKVDFIVLIFSSFRGKVFSEKGGLLPFDWSKNEKENVQWAQKDLCSENSIIRKSVCLVMSPSVVRFGVLCLEAMG